MSNKKSKLNVELLTLAEKIRLSDLSVEVAATTQQFEGTMSLLNTAFIGHRLSRAAELLRDAAELCDSLAYYEKIRVAREAETARRGEVN